MLAFLQGFNAALNCKPLTDCPFNVHNDTQNAAAWVSGYLDCSVTPVHLHGFNSEAEQFEKAFEAVVESQLHLLSDPNDNAVPLVRDAGEPGSKDRIDMMVLFYEEQMEKPEDERESAFTNITLTVVDFF